MSFSESEKKNIMCECEKGYLRKNNVSSFNFNLKGNWFKTNGSY